MPSRTVVLAASLVAAALAGALSACGRCGGSAPSEPAATQAEPATAPAGDAAGAVQKPPEAPTEVDAEAMRRVKAALRDLSQRARCNRVMGCEPAVRLAQDGAVALPALVHAIQTADRGAGYWLIKCIDLVGQLGGASELPTLYPLLADKRWEVRAHAGLALGRLAEPQSAEIMVQAVQRLRGEGGGADVPLIAALLHALDRVDGSVDGNPARSLLVETIPLERSALGRLNPGHYAFLAELVREARLKEAAPLVRWGAIHRDRFVRLASLSALSTLGDEAGVPYAVTRLDDELPSVRRAALGALRRITGRDEFTEAQHWKDWCEHRDCLAPLRESAGEAPSPD